LSEVVKIKKLNKVYPGPLQAVRDVNLQIGQGEVHALLGPNGAGKTTTIKSILGFVQYSGEISVLNSDIDSRRGRIAFVPEEKSFYEFLTPSGAITLCESILPSFDRKLALDYVKRFLLPLKKKIRDFSHGMKTSLYLSLTFSQGADLYIFDEPTWGLDPIRRDDVLNIIRNTLIEGSTVLYTSHIISEVERIADRVSIMMDGHVVFTGYLDDIKEKYRIFYLPVEFARSTKHQTEAVLKDREKLTILTKDTDLIDNLGDDPGAEMTIPDLELFFQLFLRGRQYV